jgi:hypothetical protein
MFPVLDDIDIPNLTFISSLSDDESEDLPTTASRALSPRSMRDASNFVLKLCQLLFTMMVVDKAFGGTRKSKRF